MNSKTNTKFTLIIIGLALLMIAGLSICFIMLFTIADNGLSTARIILFFSGLGAGIFGLITIIKQSKNYTKNRVKEVRNGEEAFLTKWEINKEQWATFYKAKYESDIKESTGYGWAAAALMGVVSGFSLWNKFDLIPALVCIMLVATFFFFVGKYAARLKARSDFKKHSQLEVADIHFAKSSIIFNSSLILINVLGYRLKGFSVQDKFNMKVIAFTIESGVGHRKSSHDYTIPMPADKLEEAIKLSSYYNGIA